MPGRFAAIMLTVALPSAARALAAGEPDPTLAIIAVSAGETERADTPVCVDLPAVIHAWRPMRLEEIRGDERVPVPSQIEAGKPAKLWWVLSGKTPAGATRRYALRRGSPVPPDPATEVRLAMTARTLDVGVGGAPLFSYNHAHVVPPKGVRPEYIRSGYIHPMFSPSGMLLTEDFPSDHHHHKGIWFPWTSTEFKGHHVDFWNLGARQGTVQFAGFERVESGPVFGHVRLRHEHLDITRSANGEVVLDETWDVRIWAVGGRDRGYWVWDLTSTQECVASSPLHLNAYRYGGLGFRGPREWKGEAYRVLTSEGRTKANGHATRARWCAHSGAIGGKWSTVVIMCHPRNERFPEPMRIWARGGAFFNFCPIQKEPMDLEPGEPHVFRYRFFVHEGAIDAERAERAWRDFGAPPRATLRLAP